MCSLWFSVCMLELEPKAPQHFGLDPTTWGRCFEVLSRPVCGLPNFCLPVALSPFELLSHSLAWLASWISELTFTRSPAQPQPPPWANRTLHREARGRSPSTCRTNMKFKMSSVRAHTVWSGEQQSPFCGKYPAHTDTAPPSTSHPARRSLSKRSPLSTTPCSVCGHCVR